MTTPRGPIALALALLASAALARAEAPLKWSPKAGEEIKYTFTQAFNSRAISPGQEVSSKIDLDVDLTWKVTKVEPDGAIELDQTVDRARARLTGAGVVLTYDSAEKQADNAAIPPEVKAYEVVVGKPYAIKLSPQGEILDVKVPEAVTSALADSPLAASADTGSFYSALGVKNFLGDVLPKLSREPIEKGSAWSRETALNAGPLKIATKTNYKVGETAPLATIDAILETTITPAADAPFIFKVTKHEGSGTFSFDPAAGRLESSRVTQSVELSITDPQTKKDATQATEITVSLKLRK